MIPIDAVFFDAGGTLFTERPSRHGLYARAARERGLAVDDERMRAAMAAAHAALPQRIEGHFRYSEGWFRAFIECVFGGLGFAGDFERLCADLFATFRSASSFALYPEVKPVLKRIKGSGRMLGVISNWSPPLALILGKLGLAGDFAVVIASAVAHLEKPDPAIFLRAAAAAGVAPARCLHVGDRLDNDFEGATRAGMRALLLDRGSHDPSQALAVPARVADLNGVLDLLGLPPVAPTR